MKMARWLWGLCVVVGLALVLIVDYTLPRTWRGRLAQLGRWRRA